MPPKAMRPSIAKLADAAGLLAAGRRDPASAFPEIERLAASDAWQTREVAATLLVEIAKRHPDAVIGQARRWAVSADANLRRAASEGLRGVARRDPPRLREVLDFLRADPELYVRKSVANILRDASTHDPDLVLSLCREWSRSAGPNTQWVIREGLRKLAMSRPNEVEALAPPSPRKPPFRQR